MPPLDRVQQWMQTVLTHPGGVSAGIASAAARAHVDLPPERIEDLITRSQRLTALERLQVYGNAWFARLLECLQDEFPATRHAVGDDAFTAFVFGYLQRCPPRSYTLAMLGDRFPQHLDETQPPGESSSAQEGSESPPGWAAFVVDLARLERTYSEVFDGPGPEREPALRAEDLRSIPPERWGEAALVPSMGLRLEAFRFPVHDYVSAVRRKENPVLPAPSPTFLAVYRSEFIVRRLPLEPAAFAVLRELAGGRALEAALATALDETGESPDELAPRLGEWLKTWATLGFFRGVQRP